MDEDEAALLAELRAISQKSAASRFDDSNSDNDEKKNNTEDSKEATAATSGSFSPAHPVKSDKNVDDRHGGGSGSSTLPPWKQRRNSASNTQQKKKEDEDVNVLIVAESPSKGNNKKSTVTSTPPWKRKKKVAAPVGITPSSSEVDVVVVAAPPQPLKNVADTVDANNRSKKDITTTTDQAAMTDAEAAASLSPKRNVLPWKRGGKTRVKADVDAVTVGAEELLLHNNNSSRVVDHSENHISNTNSRKSPVLSWSSPPPPWKRQSNNKTTTPVEQQQQSTSTSQTDVETTRAADSVLSDHRSPSVSSSTVFHGDERRGGAAEDAELLALLRGVSANAPSSSRFDDDNDDTNNASSQPVDSSSTNNPMMTQPESKSPTKSSNVGGISSPSLPPPWKRAAATKTKKQSMMNVEISVAAPPPTETVVVNATSSSDSKNNTATVTMEPKTNYGIKSDLPSSTFMGERGGAAQDAELLALLRGVSSKSAASRFDDDDNDNNGSGGNISVPRAESREQRLTVMDNEKPSNDTSASAAATEISNKPSRKSRGGTGMLPPWKRGGKKKQAEVEVMIATTAAPPPNTQSDAICATTTESPAVAAPSYGIKSELPSTFKGERGGAAEDAELLALLRGVSSKSGASRFDDEGGNGKEDNVAPVPTEKPAVQTQQPTMNDTKPSSDIAATAAAEMKPPRKSIGGMLPPWKRGGKKKVENQQGEVEVMVATAAAPLPTAQADSSTPAAPPTSQEASIAATSYGIKSDLPSTFEGERGGAAEDAELLALLRGVSSQASTSRFSADPASAIPTPAGTNAAPAKSAAVSSVSNVRAQPPAVTVMTAQSQPQSELTVSRDRLPESLTDKNWKVRSQAYDVLASILKELAESSNDLVDSDEVLEGLDDQISVFVQDSNANALDKALNCAYQYAEYCRSAGNADQAGKITSALLKKNAFSSKPKTLKLASSLTLKLMEVGADGVLSVHSVIDVLLNEGLISKKPKVIQASAMLVLEAAYDFGAASLPLASITSAAPKILSHSNAKVRECGVKILAEICRALGSKAPLQGVIDEMKKVQLSELESLLSKHPEPTPARTGLRSQQGAVTSSSEDALAVLQAGAKELEAQRFAARPAVNLVAAIAKTDYAKQLAMPKWSQKVAALDLVLECGGEKPYKLMQPSSSVNYSPLIVEMKKMLSHTHFAVCSKAMEVLSMLAVGVGEKLYPYLRPMLTPLLQMSKDKKLTSTVASCLDSFFGNILSFDNLLDKDDALPSGVDERNQKNALVRVTAFEFLGRCVERNSNAGRKAHFRHSPLLLSPVCALKSLGILMQPSAGHQWIHSFCLKNSTTRKLQNLLKR